MPSWAEEVEREAELLAERELAAELRELHAWAAKELGTETVKLVYGRKKRMLELVAFGDPPLAMAALRRLVENQAAAMWEEA